jgi:hypothetical protein
MTRPKLQIYVCTDHDGFYPVPRASVVVARDEAHARELLDAELVRRGLRPMADRPYTLRRLDTQTAHALILSDGDY